MLFLGLSGVISWWTQEWHSVFPYLIRYNVALLFLMSVFLAPRGRTRLLLLGSLSYALPALCGPAGFLLAAVLMLVVGRSVRWQAFFTDWRVLLCFWLATAFFMVQGSILTTIINQVNAYLKHTRATRRPPA